MKVDGPLDDLAVSRHELAVDGKQEPGGILVRLQLSQDLSETSRKSVRAAAITKRVLASEIPADFRVAFRFLARLARFLRSRLALEGGIVSF